MRKGGETFDESEVFDVEDSGNANASYDQGKFYSSFYAVDSAASAVGLEIADLICVDADWAIHTPENDLLVLKKPGAAT